MNNKIYLVLCVDTVDGFIRFHAGAYSDVRKAQSVCDFMNSDNDLHYFYRIDFIQVCQ